MVVKCMPKRELYKDSVSGYRIISCVPLANYSDLELNPRYMTFTLSGSNLNSMKIDQEANIIIEPDEKSKYPASYILTGYEGLKASKEGIEVEERFEPEILRRLMTVDQAENVHKAYPHFIQMILNNHEDEIDYKNIFNVGEKRLADYISKVQGDCKNILFYPIAYSNGITSSEDVSNLRRYFESPEDLKMALEKDPYYVYIKMLGFGFEKADRLVLNHYPEYIDTQVRCEYGCLEILKENESLGDTRINANIMASEAKKLMPEASHHMVKAVNESELMHFDNETKYVSIKDTYEAEKLIAKELLERINNPEPLGMEWEKFRKVDGFECTDEQVEILRLIDENKTCMLRGGGGTGKSSAMKALVLMLEHYGVDYIQLAPTGIASKRLRETTGRYASTIHMFLARHKEDKIYDTVVLIDESSILGVHLLANLLSVLDESCRIVFICDEAQLASISCGNVVQDIIDSGVMPTATLTKVFRYGSSGLATIATDTRNGKLGPRDSSKFNDYQFYPIEDDPVKQIVELYGELLNEGYTKDEILVLCPFNKGKHGTYIINNAIQEQFNKHPDTKAGYEIKGQTKIMFKVGDKVLNTKNNYDMPCYDFEEDGEAVESIKTMFVANGDIGYVIGVHETAEGMQLEVEFDNDIACVKGDNINHLLLGYAESIHRVQGTEAKAVIMFTSNAYKRMLSKNLLYVGDSRAKEKLIEIGDIEAIQDGLKVEENKVRDTWLKEMLLSENL